MIMKIIKMKMTIIIITIKIKTKKIALKTLESICVQGLGFLRDLGQRITTVTRVYRCAC